VTEPSGLPYTGTEDKWRVCIVCRHLRIEHDRQKPGDGARCDVIEPNNDGDPRRCSCTGFRTERRGARQ